MPTNPKLIEALRLLLDQVTGAAAKIASAPRLTEVIELCRAALAAAEADAEPVSFATPVIRPPGTPPVVARSLDGRTAPGEPFIVLPASDPASDGLVEIWAETTRMMIAVGVRPRDDMAKVIFAHRLAEDMRNWRIDRPDRPATEGE